MTEKNKRTRNRRTVSLFTAIFIVICLCFSSASVCALSEDSVSAKAAVLIDKQTGRIIYSKNAGTKLPMASTTKIMTTLLTLESGDLDTEFTVNSQAIRTEGSSMGLREGDIVSKRDLCIGMLLPSGNDAANAAAVRVGGTAERFIEMMNSRAGEMGLTSTHFVTPSGLHDEEHYSTAYDMAVLTSYALDNEDFAAICSQSSMKLSFGAPPYERWLTNSNKLLKRYEGCIGVKTGFTDEAGRCLVSAAERDGITLICVTLNAPDDWNDHTKLFDYGFSVAKKIPVELDFDLEAQVVGGKADTVSLAAAEIPSITCITGQKPTVTWKAVYPKMVYAPVKYGDVIGRIEIYDCGKLVCTVPLTACSDVDYKTAVSRKNPVEEFIDSITERMKKLFE